MGSVTVVSVDHEIEPMAREPRALLAQVRVIREVVITVIVLEVVINNHHGR